MSRRGLAVGLALVVVAGLGAFVATQMSVTTDITHFMPHGEGSVDVALARQITQSELSRTMVLVIDAPTQETAVAASRALEDALLADAALSGAIAFIEGGPTAGVDEALWSLYHPRRFSFVAASPADARAKTSDAALSQAAERLKTRLASPMSTLLTRVAPSDPLLILPDLFDRVSGGRADGLTVVDGRFVATGAESAAVLFVGTTAASFDGPAQRVVLDGVDRAFEHAKRTVDGPLTLLRTGAGRYAVQAETGIKADILRVTLLSLTGLVVLFFVLFRSLRLVLLTSLPIGAGMLVGTAGCLALFGQIHGLTLAFGAALIGVSIDYTAHFYSHHALDPAADGPVGTMRRVWPGLLLGAATTVAGFIALAVSSFPGLRELAVFAALGITGALVATWVFMPVLVPRAPRPVAAAQALAGWLARGVATMRRRRAVPWGILLVAVGLCAVGLPGATWQDDIARLNDLDPALVAEDEAVRARVIRYEQRRFVAAVGETEEAALQANDAVAIALKAAQDVGELGGARTTATMLPSASQQTQVRAAFVEAPTLADRFDAAFAAAGFNPAAFGPFRAALTEPAPPPLTWAMLTASPLAAFVRSFRVTLGDDVAILSFLHDVRDEASLRARLEAVDGAHLVDISETMTTAYARYRVRMMELLLAGLLAVLLLIIVRYRDVRRVAAAFVPALLAAGVTVAMLSLVGQSLNVLSLTALLMVVSMGVDYGVFLAEGTLDGAGDAHLQATLVALVVACVSTVLGFGLLALSDHPALSSLGLTAGIGVTASVLIAPSVLVLTRAPEAA